MWTCVHAYCWFLLATLFIRLLFISDNRENWAFLIDITLMLIVTVGFTRIRLQKANKLCGSCGKAVNRQRPWLQFASFWVLFYHGECVGIVGQQLDNLRIKGIFWTCPQCRGHTRTYEEASQSIDSPIGESFLGTLEEIRTEQKMIKEQQLLKLKSVNFCSNKILDFEVEL